ncbi:hypothetical protein THIOSC13_1850005 [uncultured Thiomicrorhabdus sp.]
MIDIVPPIEPQPVAGAFEFSWLLILMTLVLLFLAWRWSHKSRAWQVWQALKAWQKQGPTASLWQLVDMLQILHNQTFIKHQWTHQVCTTGKYQ